ncbi:helix-hairpin-helix domain-containing protein [Amycolatopsis australiensis]|uniref:Pathogenicity locus n=1 Tax=Amycolatopsis australiensis TaxID=546364 RepID=A0A1K1PIN8_9PSEU|nr:helix-hairpin-helix domain-containing protein [Amycolatopsis australiensis]SFW47468.1 Pathogenicity locus [Amycolatopsis australiensis]
MSKELLKLANIGPAMVRDLVRLGITEPAQLAGRDPVELYDRLGELDGQRPDPCVLDTFMSAVDQAGGAPPRPWWTYTAERKCLLGSR